MMASFRFALFGPRIYRPYQSNMLESGGNTLISIGTALCNVCTLFSPLLVPYVLFTFPVSSYGSLLRTVATFYALAYSLRVLGRITNGEYRHFIGLLEKVEAEPDNREIRSMLKRYDYQVFAAPVDFRAVPSRSSKWYSRVGADHSPDLGTPVNLMRRVVGWTAANTFGRRMLYPGSMSLFHFLMNDQMVEGRRKLLEEKGGERNVILAEDGNRVDTVFVDRRGQSDPGDTLVICCEGNAGYLEMGVMMTPTNLEYSVLGWNLPGFAESTGVPYPDSILNSMEAVVQFATNKLGFRLDQIVLYAWSIGGFPATWAAANYPLIRALILDASFDDLIPLALARMPSGLEGLVHFTVREYLNLPVAKQLARYAGPIRLIRRWNDEIIITETGLDSGRVMKRASNRANYLLIELLRSRHPDLLQNSSDEQCVFDWLEKEPQDRLTDYDPEDSDEPSLPKTDLSFLVERARHRLIRQLCTKYFVDFEDATHNIPLSPQFFNIPTAIL